MLILGGVTSSSLEVLASLCLNDQEFAENMLPAADGTVPNFYNEYVQDIINIIEENARKGQYFFYSRI
jgi:glutamate dehydrogenase